ncbi:MarR family winged helix-turn-helix transcriptional regulator [Thermomonospora catenispora]|uniref:MarR family winged helix-turn-helix transcriptional regulator n=1 Tax=Thermomonospora catenispora TaxID=2493090 RepID=UPI0011219B28|nr:MarR family winged helix-turn-helix transcriptional regulator [Thermomonospora catenispora]TNY38932.1 MarR family transcriptional regulator [Thermomonospora catenispora]
MTEQPIGYWIRRLDTALEEVLDRALAEEGVGRRHWQALNVFRNGPVDAAALTDRLAPFWTEGAITPAEVVEDLTRRGWLERTVDGRLGLTAEGASARSRLSARVEESRRRLAEGITPEEYATTLNVLRRMAENAQALV